MTNFFNSLDNTNKSDLLQASENPQVKRSVLPYGRTNAFTFNEGAIVPLDYFPIIPGDSIDLNFNAVISCLNPFKDKMFSGMKLSIHAYYQKYEHEWTGWKNYATEGRRGNQTLSLPFFIPNSDDIRLHYDGYRVQFTSGGIPKDIGVNFCNVGSLSAYLVNFATTRVNNGSSSNLVTVNSVTVPASSIGLGPSSQVNRSFYSLNYDRDSQDPLYEALYGTGLYNLSAIPFSIYQRIYRDFYLNKNLCKDNPLWFPDDEDDFVIPYVPSAPGFASGQVNAIGRTPDEFMSNVYQVVPNNHSTILTFANRNSPNYATQYADAPVLGALRYRQFDGDLFTTGLPFLERGGTTKLWNTIQGLVQSYFSGVGNGAPDGTVAKFPSNTVPNNGLQPSSTIPLTIPTSLQNYTTPYSFDSTQGKNSNNQILSNAYGIFTTWNQIAELGVMQLWSRRNAQTDGDYNSLIRAHYGINPKSQDRRAQYLGGAIIRLNFDNVIQNSESGNTPLGTRVALASGSGSGSIGHYEFNDFGAILIVGSLIPDTFYTQGLRPWFDAEEKSIDLPYPEFTSLPRASVPLKRVFFTGSGQDLNLFNYNERFLEYKYRDNVLSGHLLDYKDLKWSAMSFARYMDTPPVFNNEFVTASPYNLRSNMYSVPSQPHWIMQFADSIRLVRALPYVNKEATLNM